ncbi:hypothetical protein I4F81_010061 [Pyropia yezoensis]|uniref:Uncharacterized protein n=1 Tax=Pyropia yezoensis TaxID=2788 RepID=A0ACC3CBE4_PYRYE|nr:hypothetical protein I4F81_010061 [Neopyropia yezoensis]
MCQPLAAPFPSTDPHHEPSPTSSQHTPPPLRLPRSRLFFPPRYVGVHRGWRPPGTATRIIVVQRRCTSSAAPTTQSSSAQGDAGRSVGCAPAFPGATTSVAPPTKSRRTQGDAGRSDGWAPAHPGTTATAAAPTASSDARGHARRSVGRARWRPGGAATAPTPPSRRPLGVAQPGGPAGPPHSPTRILPGRSGGSSAGAAPSLVAPELVAPPRPAGGDAHVVPHRGGRRCRTIGRGGYFWAGGVRSVPAPGPVIQKIRIARDSHLGYHPGDMRLLQAARRAAKHLTRGVSFTRQTNARMARAIAALEEEQPALQRCIGCWGACSFLSSHLRNVSGDVIDGGGGGEGSPDVHDLGVGNVRLVPVLLPSGGGSSSSLVQGRGVALVSGGREGEAGTGSAGARALSEGGSWTRRAPMVQGRLSAGGSDAVVSRQANFLNAI